MFKYSMKKYYKFYITVFILMLCFLTTLTSVGFAALNQNLNITGDIDYEPLDKILYNVLKRETMRGTYAKEYTGEHQDSFTLQPSQKVYHWYGSSDTNATTILNRWNVLFAGFCWQMIRTTDTGGVKLLYNGIPNEGKCNNSGTNQQVTRSYYNSLDESPAYVGYKYNTAYTVKSKRLSTKNLGVVEYYCTNSYVYYFGTGVSYNASTGMYTLSNVSQNKWGDFYSSPESSGIYSCLSTTDTSCSSVYYLVKNYYSDGYGFEMKDGHLLSYYDTSFILGSNYVESNGNYTLTNTTTIKLSDYIRDNSAFENKYYCDNNATSCTVINQIIDTAFRSYTYLTSNNKYLYATNFSYNSSTGIYTLSSDRVSVFDMSESSINSLETHHYTCFNTTGTCNKLSYVTYVLIPSSSNYLHYVEIVNNKTINTMLNEMLYNDDVNNTDSPIKTTIDNWYAENLTSYTSKLEDTIFCNCRDQKNTNNGWNSGGGDLTASLTFNYDESLKCKNDVDKFCVSNNKAKLLYPVGVESYMEAYLLNNAKLRNTGQSYWVGLGRAFGNNAVWNHVVNTSGSISYVPIGNSSYGVRPVVSLKSGTEYVSGDGSKNNPYIVE